jgi:N-acetylmuramoyl-L-alanine amidase
LRVVVACAWILMFAAPAWAATLAVPWSQPAEFATWQEDGVAYVRATQFFTLLGGTVDLGTYPVDATVGLRGHTLSLFHGSPFVRYDDGVYDLVQPVFMRDGDPALPLLATARLVGEILKLDAHWTPESQTLQFLETGGEIGPITGQLKRNGLILEIHTGGPVTYEVYQSIDDWLTVTIPGATRGDLRFNRRPFSRYIWEFKSYQFDESVQLSFRFRPDRVRWEHRIARDPYRIEVTLIDTTFALDSSDTPGILGLPAGGTETGLETDPIDVIVVDAGHGGEDLGAVGRRGTREKDVVLGVALELAALLRSDPDFKVILTRRDDTFVPLQKRAQIANDANADLFISLHANSAPRRSARGFETFFLSAAKTDEARATQQLENASLRFEESAEMPGTDDLDFILTDLLQNQYLVESAALAESIQKELGTALRAPDRGVNQAGFVVLYYAYMPAVLVETGFLSNTQEESWLAKESSHQRLAEAIYRSIIAFRDRYEEKL